VLANPADSDPARTIQPAATRGAANGPLLLAPMEGLLDCTLRDILTRIGGIDRCVSEFIRVSGSLLPDRVFLRLLPELRHGSRTPAGVPVRAQLMGSDAGCLAENAAKLAALGPAGVDLNFGCPAKTVNRHRGGAALLDEPELIHRLVAAVRRAVPAGMPVSAKMRLGYCDDARALDCARAIAAGGAEELVVHARTKAQGYRPPAYWERVGDVRAAVPIPVIANGEIWTLEDARLCRERSGCSGLMLGRGVVTDPGLALAIAADAPVGLQWPTLLPSIAAYWELLDTYVQPGSRPGRMKQWLNYLRRRHPEAEVAYQRVRLHNDPALVERLLFGARHGIDTAGGQRPERTPALN
jgi:tRNA-dihydrouridine synthase C